MASSSPSVASSDSDSDSEALHELCNNVNLGLAKANKKSSLSAITTDGSTDQINEGEASLGATPKKTKSKTGDSKKPLPETPISRRDPILQRKDSVEKVIQVIDSRTFAKAPPSTTQCADSLPKDKLILNSETLLILNLLGMPSNVREQYLIDVAKQRKLLLTNPKTNTFNVNPQLFDVNNVPQVVDFVHQFHGKPMAQDLEIPGNVARKSKQRVKKKEKEKQPARTLVFDNQKLNIAVTSEINVQGSAPQAGSSKAAMISSVSHQPRKTDNVQPNEKIGHTLKSSAQSSSMTHLNKIMDKPTKKPRTLSACEQAVSRVLRQVEAQRQNVDEECSKRAQKQLRKKLRALSLECKKQANAEKPPRKRGGRGSKKMADPGQPQSGQSHTGSTAPLVQTDVAAKNLIRNKCSQINIKIQEKLNLCANNSAKAGPSTSKHQTDDLVIESIVRGSKSDEDDSDSSSVSSDSSNFPYDEETTSYFAKSDEMESSCNEKRTGTSESAKKSALKDDLSTPSIMHTTKQTVSETNQLPLQKRTANSNAPSLINDECLLIMSLLTAKNESARNSLLQKAAVNSNIFLKKQEKKVLNDRLVKMKNVFTSPAIVKFIDDNTPKRRKEKETYESAVNELVRRYTAEADMFKYVLNELVLQNGRYAFNDPVNRKSIDSFIQSLIAANLGKIVEGDVRVNEYDNTEAYMTNDEDDRDIYFSSMLLRQCALHCTRVRAFAFTAEDQSPYARESVKRIVRGFVFEILDDQSKKQIVGKFDMKKAASNALVIIPDDRRLPRFKIDKSSDPMFSLGTFAPKENTLYMVQLRYWKDKKPYAGITEEIGKSDELDTGNRAVLLKNCLKPLAFSDNIMAALPKQPFVIPEAEYNSRENLTKECIFTIDPLTARDLDDAVSCKKLENGNYEIGVHISDVSYFINENSELDNVIKDQATTIYLVNTVYHMLPRELCMLCSLLPGQDKLTFSVFWEMTPAAQIVSTRFSKTIINSCSQFAYEHAQLMIEQPDREFEDGQLPKIHRFTHRDLSQTINMLNSIATILRKGRYDNGCISINQRKIVFDLNENGEPIAFRPDERGDSNFLIEEFMLLANQSVAKFIFDKFPTIAVLRNHAPPKANMMTELVTKMAGLNHKMDISSAKAIADSIAAIIRLSGNNEAVSTVLNSMVAKPMVRAEYICSGHIKNITALRHFALSIPIYTHFTSPIRRYPDILVHRLLAAALNLAPIPTRSQDELKSIARTCNDQKYNAKLAGEDSTNLYFLHYLRLFGPIKMRAAVKEQSKGTDLHLMLIDSGHNIRVNIKHNEPEIKFSVDDGIPRIQFVGCKNLSPIRVNIFDVVQVEVSAKDEKLKAKLVPPN
ncbi:uncharacterized protein LOC119073436 isoform X2 [Bradysia coprophila]|uniref:uncharacterized protein LOC119073436 isoform X2 n=1 Tax=Bradysia coprophila TaxID=38358 RepID=UPI00187DCAEC|nr:uncharacterized protein LOC119073436 isoform X2 [Bradysia coprophila]